MEHEQQQANQHDFWLLQYQKLLDSHPQIFAMKSANIDPLLGYNFLLNGVVHCLPFLFKIWQTKKDLIEITDHDLSVAGVHNQTDRAAILRSIYDYVHNKVDAPIETEKKMASPDVFTPSAVPFDDKSASGGTPKEASANGGGDVSRGETLAECVVCMEESVRIFFHNCFGL